MLLNSIDAISDGYFLGCYAQEGIVKIAPNSELEFLGSTIGNPTSLREPVGAWFIFDHIFICDWHGRRIVLADNTGKFLMSYGKPFSFRKFLSWSNIKSIISFFTVRGSFIVTHYASDNPHQTQRLKISEILLEIKHYLHRAMWEKISIQTVFLKPNGICGVVHKGEKLLFVSDKNLGKLVRLKLVGGVLFHDLEVDLNGGRLGNVCTFNGRVYVADETNRCIWSLDLDMKEKIKLDTGRRRPFAVKGFQNRIYYSSQNVICRYPENKAVFKLDGEVHSLTVSGKKIFAALRDKGTLIECN
jgi:hypothetical protein